MIRAKRLSEGTILLALVVSQAGYPSVAEAQTVPAEPFATVDIGDRRQVFIDKLFLAESRGVELVVHPPRKTGEHTIPADRPWERGGIGPYSSVMKVGDTYYLWYHAMDSVQWHTGDTNGCICFARSDDGVHWKKPELGLIEYQGDKANNIVIGHGAAGLRIGQDGMMVFLDPTAPAEQRFRMVARFGAPVEEGQAIHIFSSPDGIHWTLTHPSVVTARPQERGHHLDCQNVIFWDERIGKYVVYVRKNRSEPGSQGRCIARGESERLGGFPVVQDMPIVFGGDRQDLFHGDTPVVDFYLSAAIQYPWAERAYYMFPTAYYHYIGGALGEFPDAVPTNAGPLDTQFAASRDGIVWHRYDRRAFVPLGMKGEFDWASARMIRGLVPDTSGREMYMYYRASDWLHGWDRDERNKRLLTQAGLGADQNIAVLSRLVLRRDGFVSVRAAYTGGEFTTPPLVFNGRRLVLNIDTSATGIAQVGILDADGKPHDGFAAGQCDRIHTCNEINRTVTWQRRSDLGRLAGKPVRLRFVLSNCDLYAFQFIQD
ncbi:MAG: hypothetical protein JXA69_19790 [Phycisphaerae bacterium]|nr:hypothetical protein [Phycisphaerae bacterium]